jgi:hypothetical protein
MSEELRIKSVLAAASAAMLIALPALAETDPAGPVTAGFGLGQSRGVAALDPKTSETLLGKAAEAGKFSTFLSAVEAAGLDDALRQPGLERCRPGNRHSASACRLTTQIKARTGSGTIRPSLRPFDTPA